MKFSEWLSAARWLQRKKNKTKKHKAKEPGYREKIKKELKNQINKGLEISEACIRKRRKNNAVERV